jgi:carbonyl reductase 1
MYGVSKLGECSLTRVLAREAASGGIFAAAVCPGWCATDMSSRSGPNTAAQGADVAVWAALAPRGALPTGAFWRQRAQESF